ncbi:hypothetical protein [Pedobacter kyungheensis]|uniref:hypothetical protein n=1 Tax=Pedobacter kyungheensis TaxID=1069985 RepID=UPI0012E04670|nr:hypothetical protein [Pedobacter kyungheensis]
MHHFLIFFENDRQYLWPMQPCHPLYPDEYRYMPERDARSCQVYLTQTCVKTPKVLTKFPVFAAARVK